MCPFSFRLRNGLGQTTRARGLFANSAEMVVRALAECEAATAPALFAKTYHRASVSPDEAPNRHTAENPGDSLTTSNNSQRRRVFREMACALPSGGVR